MFFVYGICGTKGQPFFRDENTRTAEEVIHYVNNYIENYLSAQVTTSSHTIPRPLSQRRLSVWKPPPIGCLKLNCDASLDLHTASAGVGFILRNHLGIVIQCVLEAMAINYGVDHIQIESDAKE